jgi:tetratricopeptide (TPR) repeat protein
MKKLRTQYVFTAILPAAVSAFVLGVATPSCGGESPEAKFPATDAGAAATPASTAAAAQSTTQAPPSEGTGLTGGAKSAYDKGWAAWMAGDLQGAKAAFTDSASQASTNPAPQYALGSVLERLGDTAGAQQAWRTAFSIKPTHEPSMCAYALSLARSGHTGEADTFLTDKNGKMKDNAKLMTCQAEVKSIAKDSAGAQQLAQDALRVSPDYKEAMVVIARDHYRAGRIELARYALQAILDGFGDSSPPRDKDNAEAHLLRGIIGREQGQRLQAMKDFEAAKAKRPDLVEAQIQAGAMRLEAGNVTEALPMLESAVKFAPKSAIAHLNLGDAYRLSSRIDDAKKEFDTALSLDSSLAGAHYNLGLMYLFATNMPGMTADQQVSTAIREFETFKTMKGRAPGGGGEDVDELLSGAKRKQADLKLNASASAGAAPAGAGAKPAGGAGAAKPAAADAGAPPPKK